MLKYINDFTTLTDEELVSKLVTEEANEGLYVYFFKKMCKRLLDNITYNVCHYDNPELILGEFYEFISDNNWAVLRNWKKINGASLTSYLTSCSANYFIRKTAKEKKRKGCEISLSTFNYADNDAESFIEEETVDNSYVWKAYEMLNERDQAILQQLVIEEKKSLDAAPVVWKYINSTQDYTALPAKRVQCTLSMAKNRAQTALLDNIQRQQN